LLTLSRARRSRAASEDINRVELQARQPGLTRRQRTANQSREAQLHAPIELIERIESMLRHICPLAEFAVVEVAENRFPFDVNMRVPKLQVTLLLQATDPAFSPITAPLTRVAGCVQRLFERLCRRFRRGGENVSQVSASLRILNVVPNEAERKLRVARVEVEARNVIEQRELGSELRIADRRYARRIRGSANRDHRRRRGRVG
jgi:hypothetical protein